MNVRFLLFLFLHQGVRPAVLHKFVNNECGEVFLNKKIAPYAIRFGNLYYGSCKQQGYDVYTRKESVQMGPFGKVNVNIYAKS